MYVSSWKRSLPWIFHIFNDDSTSINEGRYGLYAYYPKDLAVDVVVGVRIDTHADAIESWAPLNTRLLPELAREFRNAISRAEGVLDDKTLEVFRKVLREIE